MKSCLKIGGEYWHGLGALLYKMGNFSRRCSLMSVRRSRAVGLALAGAGSFVWGARMAPIENERGGRRLDLDGRRSF